MLYGVLDDRFYRRLPPTDSQDDWLASATRIGASGWSAYKFLFFSPHGKLYGVMEDYGEMLSGTPPANENVNWRQESQPPIGYHFNQYSLLFFMASGELYSVKGPQLLKFSIVNDMPSNMKIIGTGGWSDFKFLMAPLLPLRASHHSNRAVR